MLRALPDDSLTRPYRALAAAGLPAFHMSQIRLQLAVRLVLSCLSQINGSRGASREVTSLVIVWLLVREGREAWNAEEDDD